MDEKGHTGAGPTYVQEQLHNVVGRVSPAPVTTPLPGGNQCGGTAIGGPHLGVLRSHGHAELGAAAAGSPRRWHVLDGSVGHRGTFPCTVRPGSSPVMLGIRCAATDAMLTED